MDSVNRQIRKFFIAPLSSMVLMAMVVAILPATSQAAPNRLGGGFTATVVKKSDGTAKVTFQPVTSQDRVPLYNRVGEEIGQLTWSQSFEVVVTDDALKKATKRDGIDIHSLLLGIGTVQTGDKNLVSGELPYAVKDLDGRELAAGTEVYFGLHALAREGTVAPVSAWSRNMGPGAPANEFNDRLMTKGVKPGVKSEVKSKPTAAKQAAKAVQEARESGVHGEPNTMLESTPIPPSAPEVLSGDAASVFGDKILSSPTCTPRSQDSLRMSSFYGRRQSFRTDNGASATSFHDGLDIAGRAGTPIVSAAPGCISLQKQGLSFNRSTGYGLTVRMEHEDGVSTQYSHMQGFSPEILNWAKTARASDKYCVGRGVQIGAVGQTGNCTGPHLHFSVRKNGKSVDPRNYMMSQSNGDLSETCATLQAKNQALRPLDEAIATLTKPIFQKRGSLESTTAQAGQQPRTVY